MLVINSKKPFYINKEEKKIRMGNFKNNAKEIEYEEEEILRIFENIKEPIDKNELIDKVYNLTMINRDEISNAIDYLFKEEFIIDYDKYLELIKDERLSRQNLFFSMIDSGFDLNNINNNENILILGLGGVGANIALTLSRAGFNNFTLVDYDKVEKSNLIRQYPYEISDIGKNKTEILKSKISDRIDIVVKTYNKQILEKKDIEKEIKNTEFVICTLDKPSRIIRRLINELCVKYNKPVIFSGFAEHVAMVGPYINPNKTACLNCNNINTMDEPFNNVSIVPSYGPLCMLISSIVSNEVINYFYKFFESNLLGNTYMFDLLTLESNLIKWEKNAQCKVCGENASK